jgi:hypothetical protein
MISSPQAELQKLIYQTLSADTGVMTLADEIYDAVEPEPFAGPHQAYVSFGPTDVVEDDAECLTAGRHTFQIDCWSRQVGSRHCKELVDAVAHALHEQPLELTDNALAEIYVDLRQVMRDPDGLTTHGVVQVTAMVEELEP